MAPVYLASYETDYFPPHIVRFWMTKISHKLRLILICYHWTMLIITMELQNMIRINHQTNRLSVDPIVLTITCFNDTFSIMNKERPLVVVIYSDPLFRHGHVWSIPLRCSRTHCPLSVEPHGPERCKMTSPWKQPRYSFLSKIYVCITNLGNLW